MKKLLVTTVFMIISISSNTKNTYSQPTFCEWLGDTAIAVSSAAILVFVMATPVVLAHGPDLAPHQIVDLGEFKLEGGGSIDNLRMSYVTHGTLNKSKDNAVLFMHGFAANHHLVDHLIGPGKAFDTDKFFVIATDSFGNTQTGYEHSTSATNSGMKMDFPAYTHHDAVNAEYKLVTEGLKIDHLVAVSGISMGGMKAIQMAVSYPDFMDAVVPIVGGALWSSYYFLTLPLLSIIESCDGWDNGNYEENPQVCASTALSTFYPYFHSREWWDENVSSYAEYQKWYEKWYTWYAGLQDARDLYLLYKAPVGVENTPGYDGNLEAALGAIKAKNLFVASPYDQFVPLAYFELQNEMIADSRILTIDRKAGHFICCNEDPVSTDMINEGIANFLSELN